MTERPPARSLDKLLRPSSIAIIGASDEPSRIGGRPLAYLLAAGFRGPLYPVNSKRPTVQGLKAYASIAAVPGPVDFAVIAVPSEQTVKGVTMRTGALWSAIAGACARDGFRPSPGRLCEFCTFKPYCPAHGGDPAQAAELRGPGTVISPTLPLDEPVPVGA